MAQIKKLTLNGKTIYPVTHPKAVIDPSSGRNITAAATQSANGLMSADDKKKLDNLSVGTDLPVATSSVLGGIKLGYAHANTKYPVALDTNNKAYVDVPYTDFDNAATRAVVYNLKPIEIRDSIVYCSDIICTSRPNNGGYSKSGDGFDIGIRPKSNPECLWRLQTVKDGVWFNNGFSAWENGNFTIGLKGMNDANKLALTGSILASAFNQDSDIRLKDDIKEAAFEEIKRISSVKLKSFVLKDDKEKQLHYGYIAQEVEDVMPEIVMRDNPTDEEPDPMRSLNYTEILALKTAYLEKKNADLEARIQKLESLVAKLPQSETEA